MPMPAFFSRLALAALLLGAAAPAQAIDAPLGYDLAALGGAELTPGRPAPLALASAAYGQDREIDEAIVLPTASPEGDDDDRKWARDYISIAAGVITAPSYNGSDDRVILPGFYLRGRLGGFAFSTRGTNLQVDLIRQKRGQKTDLKFGPIINLRSDRTGRIKDPQVEALGEKKMAVELGISA
ncbi:MipA/OmpV family protein [Sphingopyxis sp. PET50]|uniref:MipA/OmpV family protein n=1 Tax=Sphingopyxis sp. PET50 TaxID=2976533 RepID=UPI0021AF4613|nr:MipA/OmpV family protein [Sphingopyxis sp. PET50]